VLFLDDGQQMGYLLLAGLVFNVAGKTVGEMEDKFFSLTDQTDILDSLHQRQLLFPLQIQCRKTELHQL
jgi:hypothetical protein